MKRKPVTPLPWCTMYEGEVIRGFDGADAAVVRTPYGYGRMERELNAQYIVHSANAYPKLVEALRASAQISEAMHNLAVNGHLLLGKERQAMQAALLEQVTSMYETARKADNILRELGEV